jgi:HEAT repeat protein
MTVLDALLLVAAGAVTLGLAPVTYVLLGQARSRRRRAEAVAQMQNARAMLESDAAAELDDLAERLTSNVAPAALDDTIEQLAKEADTPERRKWVGAFAGRLGSLDRFRERAREARTWHERAHAVSVLGSLGLAAAVPTLASVLRDRNEDENVRKGAADALAAIQDGDAVPILIAELAEVDEQATPRVAEALIRFGHAGTDGLIALLGDKEHGPSRVWAARILADTKDPRALEPLMASVRDRHDLLRAASADALGALGDARALAVLSQAALRDPAPLVRAQAATAAARIGGEEATEVLMAALSDPDYATRLRALEAFENMRLVDTTPLEQALGDTNQEVRKRAALALARLGYLDQLVEQLAADDRQPRARAYASLLQLGRAGVIDGIVGRLHHHSMQVRASIARACGELRAASAGPALLSALEDPAWPVRASVCEALGVLRPSGASRALLGMLGDPEESVREAAALALTAYAGSELTTSQPELRVAYENGSIPVRLAVIAIVSSFDDGGADQLLVDATRDPSEAVRLRGVGALASRPKEAAVAALINALTDTSLEVRTAAVPALGSAGTAEAFEALLWTLPGAPPALRERIAEALSGVGRQHFLRSVGELARSEQLDVRLGVAWTLGKIGDVTCVPVLCDFLRDPDPKLRASAAGALGKIPIPEVGDALVKATEDRDPKTRAAAVNALGKFSAGTNAMRDVLRRRLHDPDGFVRNRAALAIARVFGEEMAEFACSPQAAQLLHDPALVIMQGMIGTQETVALALQALGDPARLPAIQHFFDREEPGVCATFLAKLRLRDAGHVAAQTRLDPTALAEQYERLVRTSQDRRERRAAIETLAGMRGDTHLTVFADALSTDPDESVRLRAAQVLARFVDDDGARAALVRAVSDPHAFVAVAAVEGLRTRREPEVASALLRRLGAGSAMVNQAVEETLAELYREDLQGFLDRTLASDRPAAIVAAIRVLELIRHPDSMPVLRHLLRSQHGDIRAAAVRASAKSGIAEAVQLIGAMFDDPHELVRMAALEVTAAQGAQSVVRLAASRTDPSAAVRSRLCQLLERYPSVPTKHLIESLLDDVSADVRASAMLTLASFGDAESLARFTRACSQTGPDTLAALRSESRVQSVTSKLSHLLVGGGDATLREHAVLAIAAVAAENYEQLVLPMLRDPRANVRLAATRALGSSAHAETQRRLTALADDPDANVRELARDLTQRAAG